MSGDQVKPEKTEAAKEASPRTVAPPAVSDSDMTHFSGKMNELRIGNLKPPSLPDLSYFDSAQTGVTDTLIDHSGTRRDSLPTGLRGQGPDSPLSSDPVVRAQQLLNRSTKQPGRNLMDPVSRAQDLFQRMEPYTAPDGTIRLRPREEEGPRRPGELPPKLAEELRKLTEDMSLHPPDDTGRLPSPEEQARLKGDARDIARMIGSNGNLEGLDSMFEEATKNGKDSLNFLVKEVNEELKKTRPDLQLKYSFDTKSAWYSRDTHGADVHYPSQELMENHSTVGLVRTTTQQNTVTPQVQDKIKSVGSMQPPGYIRTGDPRPKLILD